MNNNENKSFRFAIWYHITYSTIWGTKFIQTQTFLYDDNKLSTVKISSIDEVNNKREHSFVIFFFLSN